MILVLTFIVTTLMSVMVTDVSAVSFTRPKGANSDITLTYGGASIPMKLGAFTGFSIGNWYGYGYTYDAEAVKAWVAAGADAKNPVKGTPTDANNFLETAYVSSPLEPIAGEFTKYEFKGGTITDGTKALYDALTSDERKAAFIYKSDGTISSNYGRIAAFPQKLTTLETTANVKGSYSFPAITKADFVADATKAYKFTFYGYTQEVATKEAKGDTLNVE